MTFSAEMPFQLFLDAFGETLPIINDMGGTTSEVQGVVNYTDSLNARGRQFQYLVVEVPRSRTLAEGTRLFHRGKLWMVRKEELSTYAESRKYTLSDF